MVEIRTLNSGVKVVLEKLEYVKSAAFGVWCHTGARNEEKFNSGVSHFIEHMLFKGTNDMNAKEIAESFDKIGAQVNAYTSYEHTCYHVKSMSEYIFNALDSLFKMLNDSIFDEKELNRERKVIFEEMKMTEDTPDELCHETVCDLTFSNTPYGHPIIGYEKSLNNLKSADLIKYKENEYTKDSIVISICGNFDEIKMLDYLNGKFTKIKDNKEYAIDFDDNYIPKEKVIVKDIAQSHICLANRGPKYDSFEKYKVAILNDILGGSMSSRLFQNIREEKGLCYSVFSMMQSYQKTGIFEIYGGVSHKNIKAFINAVKEEFDNIRNNDISKEEFDKAFIQIKSGLVYASENILSNMFLNGKSLLLTGTLQTRDDNLQKLEKVELKDVNDFAKEFLNIDNFSTAIVTGDKLLNVK